MSIRFSLESDEPALRALWKKTFGDSDDYLDLVFSRILSPQRALVEEADGEIRAMLFFPAYSLKLGNERIRAGYLCALATEEAYRRRGIMSALLRRALSEMRNAGDGGAFLIPASADLARYYSRFGFEPFFCRIGESGEPDGEETDDREAAYLAYEASRRAMESAVWATREQFDAAWEECRLSGGRVYRHGEVFIWRRDGELLARHGGSFSRGKAEGLLLLWDREKPEGFGLLDLMLD